MPSVVVLVNGADQPADAPAVSALDPGLLGHGVYESIRTYDGHLFALEEHLARLADGAERLAITCDATALAGDARRAVTLRAAAGEARIRIIVTAGGQRIVICDAIPDRRGDRDAGMRAVLLPWRRDPAGPTAGVKAASTAAVRVAQRYAADRDVQTGIWLTPDGHISEALAANVFCRVADQWVTPPLADGALAGVTRHAMIRFAADAGIPISEQRVSAGMLKAASEAFLSATSEPVVPLVMLDDAPIGTGVPAASTRTLQVVFDEHARRVVRDAKRGC